MFKNLPVAGTAKELAFLSINKKTSFLMCLQTVITSFLTSCAWPNDDTHGLKLTICLFCKRLVFFSMNKL